MRSVKGLIVGLILTGILALAPTAAFAHGGGGGGGHFGGGGGHFGGGGGHFGGGHGHFGGGHFGGPSHFAGFGEHRFAGHGFAQHHGVHFAQNGGHFRHGGHFFFADPYWHDYPYYGYNDDYAGDYSDGQSSPAELTPTVLAVQKELAKLGYYHSDIDGLIGPQTESAIRQFQSVEKLPVTGQIDDPTLKALRIS
jgi:hypothetical protein